PFGDESSPASAVSSDPLCGVRYCDVGQPFPTSHFRWTQPDSRQDGIYRKKPRPRQGWPDQYARPRAATVGIGNLAHTCEFFLSFIPVPLNYPTCANSLNFPSYSDCQTCNHRPH